MSHMPIQNPSMIQTAALDFLRIADEPDKAQSPLTWHMAKGIFESLNVLALEVERLRDEVARLRNR